MEDCLFAVAVDQPGHGADAVCINAAVCVQTAEDNAVRAVFQKKLRIRSHGVPFEHAVAETRRPRPYHADDLLGCQRPGFHKRAQRRGEAAQLQRAVQFHAVNRKCIRSLYILQGSAADFNGYSVYHCPASHVCGFTIDSKVLYYTRLKRGQSWEHSSMQHS